MNFSQLQNIMKTDDDGGDFTPSQLPTDGDSHNWAPIIAKIAFLLLTVVLLIGVFYLIRNFLHAIILGILGATILSPFHKRVLRFVRQLARKLRRRRKKAPAGWRRDRRAYARSVQRGYHRTAALISVVGVFCIIAIPVGFFSFSVIRQGRRTLSSSLRWIQSGELERQFKTLSQKYDLQSKWEKIISLTQLNWQQDEVMLDEAASYIDADGNPKADLPPTDDGDALNPDAKAESAAMQSLPPIDSDTASLLEDANAAIPTPPPDLGKAIVALSRKVVTVIMDSILTILARTWILVLNFFIMLFVMFYAFQDGKTFINYLRRISPLGDVEQVLVLNRIRDVARAVFVGILGTATVQAIVAMILFRIVGIPALFWGSLLGICSLIPFVGTTLVWVPAVGYLFLTGQHGEAIFLAIGCGLIVANIDNILRPLFMSGGRTGMSYLVLFFSILGGLQAFGLVGVLYGPMISGLAALCLLIFSTQFKTGGKTTTTTHKT
jgi:predicted PurR-regulated permease PerM